MNPKGSYIYNKKEKKKIQIPLGSTKNINTKLKIYNPFGIGNKTIDNECKPQRVHIFITKKKRRRFDPFWGQTKNINTKLKIYNPFGIGNKTIDNE